MIKQSLTKYLDKLRRSFKTVFCHFYSNIPLQPCHCSIVLWNVLEVERSVFLNCSGTRQYRSCWPSFKVRIEEHNV